MRLFPRLTALAGILLCSIIAIGADLVHIGSRNYHRSFRCNSARSKGGAG